MSGALADGYFTRRQLVSRETGAGEPVVLLHGSFSDAESTFAAQSPLAEQYRLVWVERRGAGKGPTASRVDFEADALDLVELLASPAHIVAHSYGAIGAILAAARAPAAVRSLVVIEPPFYRAAETDAAVQSLIPRLAQVYREADPHEPDRFRRTFRDALGYSDAAPAEQLERGEQHRARPSWWDAAARAAMTERPPWEAELPAFDWSLASFPRCVVSGDWSNANTEARMLGGAALNAVASALASLLVATHVVIQGASHNPQRRAHEMNSLLLRHFRRATHP